MGIQNSGLLLHSGVIEIVIMYCKSQKSRKKTSVCFSVKYRKFKDAAMLNYIAQRILV